MTAEVICVGSEILYGDILNTNTQYLSSRLYGLGYEVLYQTVVGDDVLRLTEVLKDAYKRSQVVLLTGGLGPTDDDLTKETVAQTLDMPLVRHPQAQADLESFFYKRGLPLFENNYKQADLPEGSKMLDNPNGTAPGVLIEVGGLMVALLPGPPNEMIPMFENTLVPELKAKQQQVIISHTLKMTGIGESEAALRLKSIIDQSDNPIIAPYAKLSEVHFRITGKDSDPVACHAKVKKMRDAVMAILGEYVYSETDANLGSVVINCLREKGYTLAVAESCTGGWLSKILVDEPGASSVFMEGIVTYSDAAKMRRLEVQTKTLETYGAVSHETAGEMVLGLIKTTGCDVGISLTGIAGPSGGSEDKPVGLVYVAIVYRDQLYTYRLKLSGSREKIRENAAKQALMHLYFLVKDQ